MSTSTKTLSLLPPPTASSDDFLKPLPDDHPLNFICRECRVPFLCQKDLERHWAGPLHGQPTLQCPTCPSLFHYEEVLERHWLSTHQPTRSQLRQFTVGDESWSIVDDIVDGHSKLLELVHSVDELKANNFVVSRLNDSELMELCRCVRCGSKAKDCHRKPCVYHVGNLVRTVGPDGSKGQSYWLCCGRASGAAVGCVDGTDQGHLMEGIAFLGQKYDFLHSPMPRQDLYGPRRKCQAVAIDCEMGQSIGGDRVLIQLCAVDYFSGQVLINMLVRPDVLVTNYNTKYSGVTDEMMVKAVRTGQYLDGWRGARHELWRFIDANTIIIGHGVNNDLSVLRMAHTRVVDTFIAIPRIKARGASLKVLCSSLLGKQVQTGSNRAGHDCREDAWAARELVIWAAEHPARLRIDREMLLDEEAEAQQTIADQKRITKLKRALKKSSLGKRRKWAEFCQDVEDESHAPPPLKRFRPKERMRAKEIVNIMDDDSDGGELDAYPPLSPTSADSDLIDLVDCEDLNAALTGACADLAALDLGFEADSVTGTCFSAGKDIESYSDEWSALTSQFKEIGGCCTLIGSGGDPCKAFGTTPEYSYQNSGADIYQKKMNDVWCVWDDDTDSEEDEAVTRFQYQQYEIEECLYTTSLDTDLSALYKGTILGRQSSMRYFALEVPEDSDDEFWDECPLVY